MSGAEIRCLTMTAADLPEVWNIEQFLPGPWTFNQLRDEFNQTLGRHFTLKSAAGIHGYIFGITIAGEAEIRKLAVHRHFRRQGLGHRLLKRVWRHLSAQKAAACFLEVREEKHGGHCPVSEEFFSDRRQPSGLLPTTARQRRDFTKVLINRSANTSERTKDMRNLKDINTSGKKVLMRVDFNVPFADDGSISDDTRIRAVLPSINYLLKQGARLILCSHCGRPKGKRISKYSLAPIAARLTELLGRPVALAPDCLGAETKEMARNLKDGEVLLLENLRFHAAEQNNEADFARELASLAEIYINDAFAVSHRTHASVAGVTDYLKIKAAGFLLEKEMDFFNRAIANPVKPLAVILGGAKVSSKLGAIRNMLDRVDVMIIGGAMANTFLKSQGFDVGKSLVEDDLLDTARELIDLARDKGIAFYLPVDCVAASEFTAEAAGKTTTIYNIPKSWMALDIGPATSLLYQEALAGVETIVWNGPMGAFEMEQFSRGSLTMVEAVSTSPALSIVGGGDTNALINQAGAADKISYMSTGGGAFLMLMEGKELPGVTALE